MGGWTHESDRQRFCKGLKGDNLDISQTLMQEFFAMIMLVDLADCPLGFDELSHFLHEKGEERSLDIHIQRQDIFEAMHRI